MIGTSLLICTVTATVALAPLPAGDHVRSVVVDGRERDYLVHVPRTLDVGRPVPVVLAFHPAATNGANMARLTGLNAKADEAGFVVVYPNGTGKIPLFLYWDAGGVRGDPADDVGYVARLLDDLATVVRVDPRRVYATGMSNGGMLCYRLAAELSHRIAAIAPVSGTMAIEQCRPTRPVSVLHFHGKKDGLVLYDGPNEHIPKNLVFLSVEATMRAWVRLNGCPETPVVDTLPDRVDDGTTVQRTAYPPGREGAEVILYTVEGGGHTWPGRPSRGPFLGKSTADISANDLIWDFFERHPMK